MDTTGLSRDWATLPFGQKGFLNVKIICDCIFLLL